jgi:hypothetical protein
MSKSNAERLCRRPRARWRQSSNGRCSPSNRRCVRRPKLDWSRCPDLDLKMDMTGHQRWAKSRNVGTPTFPAHIPDATRDVGLRCPPAFLARTSTTRVRSVDRRRRRCRHTWSAAACRARCNTAALPRNTRADGTLSQDGPGEIRLTGPQQDLARAPELTKLRNIRRIASTTRSWGRDPRPSSSQQ